MNEVWWSLLTGPDYPLAVEIGGYDVYRLAVHPRRYDPDEQGIDWTLSPGLMQHESGSSRYAIMGELEVRGARSFVGVTVVCFFGGVDATSSLGAVGENDSADEDWSAANEFVERWAPVVMHGIYDFAAHVARGAQAGVMFPTEIPRKTPVHQLRLVEPPAVGVGRGSGTDEHDEP